VKERPQPPRELLVPSAVDRFVPAPELVAWARATFVDRDGVLRNVDHAHLASATIGALWTDAPNSRGMRAVVGTAEIPVFRGSKWVKARQVAQMIAWFGSLPDFVLTFSAEYASGAEDATFCSLVEHELYHCGQATDEFGSPKFRKNDGKPVFTIRGHDVEEFVGIVRRYGAARGAGDTAALVEAGKKKPEVAQASIDWACGTCLRAAA
jgi:hypothetical protein